MLTHAYAYATDGPADDFSDPMTLPNDEMYQGTVEDEYVMPMLCVLMMHDTRLDTRTSLHTAHIYLYDTLM